jgi:hypothetical protein
MEVFFRELRKKLTRNLDQKQVDSINGILKYAKKNNITNQFVLSYFISTAWGECRLRPVREGFKKTDRAARAYVKRMGYKYAKVINGHVYYGRGLVQLTWDFNYEDWGITDDPDKALEPDFAAKVLVIGMLDGRYNGRGKGIEFYLDRPKPDWKNARRTVNVTDKWQKFRDWAFIINECFDSAAAAHKPGTETTPKPKVPDTSVPKPPTITPVVRKKWWQILLDLLKGGKK